MRTCWYAWCAVSGSVELQMGCSHQSSQQDIWLSRCFHHGQVGAAASPCYTGCETPEERHWKCLLAMHQWFFFFFWYSLSRIQNYSYTEFWSHLSSLDYLSTLCQIYWTEWAIFFIYFSFGVLQLKYPLANWLIMQPYFYYIPFACTASERSYFRGFWFIFCTCIVHYPNSKCLFIKVEDFHTSGILFKARCPLLAIKKIQLWGT